MTRCAQECTHVFACAPHQETRSGMLKRWKTLPALKIPACGPYKEAKLDTVDIADRLNAVVSELTVVNSAIHGLEVEEREQFGIYLVLRRQINEIISVRNKVHRSN